MSDNEMGRRAALTVLGAAGVCGVAGCGSDGGDGTTPVIPAGGADMGPVTDWTAPQFRKFDTPKVIVARDAMGFYALSRVCPHEACDVNFRGMVTATTASTGELACPCHSSAFTADGVVVSGPSPGPLAPIGVRITGGRVFVDSAITGVTRTTRVNP